MTKRSLWNHCWIGGCLVWIQVKWISITCIYPSIHLFIKSNLFYIIYSILFHSILSTWHWWKWNFARLSARPLVAAGPHAARQGGRGHQGREPRLGLERSKKDGELPAKTGIFLDFARKNWDFLCFFRQKLEYAMTLSGKTGFSLILGEVL